MKILPVGAELFHADGRTDIAKLTLDFRNFANAPNKKNHSPKIVTVIKSFNIIRVKNIAWIIEMRNVNTDLVGDWEEKSNQTYEKIILKWIIKKCVCGYQAD
jgi:hypothetical protein